MAEKVELVIAALQQRIGEIVSSYETQIAILRAEVTQLLEEKNLKKTEKPEKPKKNTEEKSDQ